MSRGWFGRRESATATAGRAPGPGGPSGGLAGRSAAPDVSETPPVPAPVLTIDALGRKCPIPIIMLAEQIRDVPVGQIVAVLADDPAAYTDVPAWCGMKSHEFVVSRELPSGWAFLIRRRY
ncbi:MAG: sulfurtransferase TusA family protein [Streptosporangiaceae bacterium]|nr:sulfurtransferase TusA family protein [Streptosporangiaceae bacterium]